MALHPPFHDGCVVQLIGVSCAYRNGLQLGKSMGVKMGEVPKLKDFAFFRLRDASLANTTGVGSTWVWQVDKKVCHGAVRVCSGYCLTQIPELQNVEIVGAMAHPDFDPKKKSYYIQLAEDWNEQLTMKL